MHACFGELPLHADTPQCTRIELRIQQNTQYYQVFGRSNGGIHTLQMEFSAAYVYNLNFRDSTHSSKPVRRYGLFAFKGFRDDQPRCEAEYQHRPSLCGGVAYELSPSWDIRAEYRGFLVKTPTFSMPGNIFNTNRYEVISTPAIGVAYHF